MDQSKTYQCKIVRIENLTLNISRVWLEIELKEHLQYFAGQYLNLCLLENRYPYSIANAPCINSNTSQPFLIELHIGHPIKDQTSQTIINYLSTNKQVTIEAPFGQCMLTQPPKLPLLFIASGTGFAPAKAMIEYVLSNSWQQKITLYWGANETYDWYLTETTQQWHTQNQDVATFLVADKNKPEDRTVKSLHGWVHEVAINHYADINNCSIYIHGSPQLYQYAQQALLAKGISMSRIHSDYQQN